MKHITNIKCDDCDSMNATVMLRDRPYCADHAYYRQTGEILALVMKNEKEETKWKWEREDEEYRA